MGNTQNEFDCCHLFVCLSLAFVVVAVVIVVIVATVIHVLHVTGFVLRGISTIQTCYNQRISINQSTMYGRGNKITYTGNTSLNLIDHEGTRKVGLTREQFAMIKVGSVWLIENGIIWLK